jgi:hypothetical protein
MRSIQAMASEILNDVYGGLNAPATPALSTGQVKDAISVMRNRLIDELSRKGGFRRKGFFVTHFVRFSDGVFHGRKALTATIPPPLQAYGVNAFDYVGLVGYERPYKWATGSPRHARRHLLTGKIPTIFIDEHGSMTLVSGVDRDVSGEIEVHYIPENPRLLVDDEDIYPMPGWMQQFVTEKLTNMYLRHYMQKNPRPVTAADIVSMAMSGFKPEHIKSTE